MFGWERSSASDLLREMKFTRPLELSSRLGSNKEITVRLFREVNIFFLTKPKGNDLVVLT